MKIISETRRTFHPLGIPANSRIDRSFDLSVMNSVLWQFTCEKLIDMTSQLQQLKLLLARNTLNLMAICLVIIIAFINLTSMVAYFCHHLSDNYVDLSDNYVDLSDLYVDLSAIYVNMSDHYVDLSEIYHHN